MPPLDFSAHGELVDDDEPAPSGPDFSGGGERVADFSAAGTKVDKTPGFFSTLGQAGLRGLKEGVTETAQAPTAFTDRPAEAPDHSYLGKILEQPVSEGWKDPNWWAAHIAYGGAKSMPSLATGAAGALAGSAVAPGVGTLVGAAGGFGLGSVIQTLAPAYQRARQEGLEHDEAVTRAMEQAGIAGAFGAAMGAAPAVGVLGRTAEGALKRPIGEALAQIFGVQPAIGAGQQVATAATEGRLPSADELGTAYAENAGLGAVLTGAHAGARRLTAKEAPALAAEEHPVPPGGAQTEPAPVPESRPRDHQVGYDLETNTFKVVGPEGETIKAGFHDDAAAETAAREMDGVKPQEVPSDRESVERPADVGERHEEMPATEVESARDTAEPRAEEIAEPINVDEGQRLNEAPRDWADIAVPLAAKEVGADLTPWQDHQAKALVRNGMDSTEAVKRVTDIPFHVEGAPTGWESVGGVPEHDRTNMATELRDRLDRLGLTDVGLNIADQLKNPAAQGSWNAIDKLINVTTKGTTPREWVTDHEAIHAMRGLRLFDAKEWAMLENAVKGMPQMVKDIESRYKNLNGAQRLEEGIAETYARWQNAKMSERAEMQKAGVVRRLMDKITNMLRAVRDTFKDRFGKPNAMGVMRAIESGKIGARERGSGEIGAFDPRRYMDKPNTNVFGEPASLHPESRRGINETRNPGAVQSDRRLTGAVKRGADAMIDRLRLQAGLDEAANRRAQMTGVGDRAPVDRGHTRELEDFIHWVGPELFANKGLRFRSSSQGATANGMYDHASRVVTIFRNAVNQGEMTRVGVHELWHSLEENLPPEDRSRVYREFNRLRDKYIKDNPWARDLLTNPHSSMAGETGSLYGSAAARWLERWGNDPAAMEAVKVDGDPTWSVKPVHLKWTDENYRYKNPSEFFAETMTDKYGEHQDIQDAKTRSIAGHLKDVYRRITNGIKRLFGYDATGRIFDRFGNREYGAHTGTGETLTSGEMLRSLNPEAPRVGEDGRNPMDATSDAIAEAVSGKGAGTYDRAMDRLRPKAGSELKNLNPVENFTIFPDTLAKTDKMFARLWNSWKGREREEHRHITGWRELIPELRNAKRGDPDVQKAYAAIEMHAINREKALPGQKVRVRNVDTTKATKSKPGEDYTLTPRQEKIYHELNALHDAEWDTMMRATAQKYGWKGDPTAAAVGNAARSAATKSEQRQLGRLAELMHLMARQKQQVYFPRSRFGDTFISVKPKVGQEPDSLGGFPELAHFETIERPWTQDVLGKSGRPDVSKRIAELRKEYPEATHEIETGLLQKRPDMLRRLDIPAVEKLLQLTEHKARRETSAKMKAREGLTADEAKAMAAEEHAAFKDDMLDTLRDVMYQEMKSGFKKKSRIVPGYSPDFDRAIGSHMHQMARHSSDLVHREGIDRAYQDIQDKHEHESTKKWVRDWRQFQDDPTTPLGRAANNVAQVGYVWTLGMNPSSTLVNLFDIPQSAIPSLAVGNGLRASMAHMGPALAEAYRHAKFNLKQGAHIALEKIGRNPDEKAFIKRLADDGSIHSVSVDDMRELGSRQAEAYGEIKSTMRRAMDIATSNMSVMDQANRAAVALSFYRMSQDPKALNKMAEAWKGNQKFRDMVEYNGLNPETMARFGLSEAAYEWGRANKSKVMRGPIGTAMFTLHGYQTRFLSNAFKLMRQMGPAGKIAAGWMMAGIWAGAGIEGLPFAQDMENLGDVVWKALTKHDPMISYRLRDALSQTGLGKVGAEIVMKGPLSTLVGTDVSNRIGFGDVLTREWSGITSGTDVLGTVPSIVFGRLAAAWRREQSRQGHAAAAAELLPAALRNPARAAIEAEQGLKTQKGKMVTPASKIGAADLTKIGLGFRPQNQARSYEHKEYGYRAKRAHGTVPHDAIPKPGE